MQPIQSKLAWLLWWGVLLVVVTAGRAPDVPVQQKPNGHTSTTSSVITETSPKEMPAQQPNGMFQPSHAHEAHSFNAGQHTTPCSPADAAPGLAGRENCVPATLLAKTKKKTQKKSASQPMFLASHPKWAPQVRLEQWSPLAFKAFILQVRQRAELTNSQNQGPSGGKRKRGVSGQQDSSPYLLELSIPSPKDADTRASLYMWMAPRAPQDTTQSKGRLRLADFALSIIGYRVGTAYWWFVQNDKASPPVLPTPRLWPDSTWDPVISTISQRTRSETDFLLTKNSVHEAVVTFSNPPPASKSMQAQRRKDLLILAVSVADAVKFQCMEALVTAAWMERPSLNGVQTEQSVGPNSRAVPDTRDTYYKSLEKVTVGQLRANWAPVIEAAELQEKELVYVGISNEQIASKLGTPTGPQAPLSRAGPAPEVGRATDAGPASMTLWLDPAAETVANHAISISLANNSFTDNVQKAKPQGICTGNPPFQPRLDRKNTVCKMVPTGCSAWFVEPPTSVKLPEKTYAMVTAGHCVVKSAREYKDLTSEFVCCDVDVTGKQLLCSTPRAVFKPVTWVSTFGWWQAPIASYFNNDAAVMLVQPKFPTAAGIIKPELLAITSVFRQAVKPMAIENLGFPAPPDNRTGTRGCTYPEVNGTTLVGWSHALEPPVSSDASPCRFSNGLATSNCIAYVGNACGGNSGGPLIMTDSRKAFGIAVTGGDCGEYGMADRSTAAFTQIVNQAQDAGAWVVKLVEAAAAALG